MPDLRKRLIAGILGAALTFAVVACGSSDSSPTDTNPDESDTPQVGS